jgi:dienelactone hydrolase
MAAGDGTRAPLSTEMLNLFLLLTTSASTAGHGLADGGASIGWKRPERLDATGRDVDYTVFNQTFQGYLAIPNGGTTPPRAAVLIAHQYMGLIDYEKARADEMASNGYVAFALDVYGKGIRCNTSACASAQMQKALSDVPRLRTLINAGAKQLLSLWKDPDPSKLVAMGYCFGGSMVLELARHPAKGASAGLTFAAVSSIHGTLTAYGGEKAAKGEVRTRVQAHHAELDFQGDEGLSAFEAEFKVGVDGSVAIWETHKYAKCEHGWTEPGTPKYRARASIQAHKSTFEFFEMALGFDDPKTDPFPSLPICHEPGGSGGAL